MDGQAAAEHQALNRLPDEARNRALAHARAGGMFIIEQHEEPGSKPSPGTFAGTKKQTAARQSPPQ